jgi:hypothetical protein
MGCTFWRDMGCTFWRDMMMLNLILISKNTGK